MTRRFLALVLLAGCALFAAPRGQAQVAPPDNGAAGAWQKLKKLTTTASVMHTTAHPDDEHGGVLAYLSRGLGARVSMLTLTRGESGDNAIGAELFDGLGLVRTEELLAAGRYYGIDRQYFGTLADYGFSKRLDEAIEKWGEQEVLRDVVAVIRAERPLVVISRFQGNARDGHGNHSAAGLVTQKAFAVSGDARTFPEQIAAGLRPWQPLKLYMGGVREAEAWTIRVDAGQYDPVLGESYQAVARRGLSFQRSQNSGRSGAPPGPSLSYYQRLQSRVNAPDKETSFFDGIDVTIPGLYRALGRTAPPDMAALLDTIDKEVRAAAATFVMTNPAAAAPALARALTATRAAIKQAADDRDVTFALSAKEQQIEEAMHAVLGVSLTATAQTANTPQAAGPFGPAELPMPPVVPGQTFDVRTVFVQRSPLTLSALTLSLVPGAGAAGWKTTGGIAADGVGDNEVVASTFSATVPAGAAPSRPYFSRNSIQDVRYTVAEPSQRYRPWNESILDAVARYTVEGVAVSIRRPVSRLESELPYGYSRHALAIVPALAVTLTPSHIVSPLRGPAKVRVMVEVLNNQPGDVEGTLKLETPAGWTSEPANAALRFSRPGERALYNFQLDVPALGKAEDRIRAVATLGGRQYSEGYTTIRHRDLETRYLYRDAVATVRGIDVTVPPNLKVGYVMGVGDDVPSGLAQLGAEVQLLGPQELATADLSRFSAIITGTRAYAVRDDLKTYNRRLLDYVREGGNLIVLYNTQEFVPKLYAPYPADLPGDAEEVSEEDSPVQILAPNAAVLTGPNRITPADFEGWVEQRGSKYWKTWDARYTPIIATWDKGQAPQQGGWLYTKYGAGHYTYFAYALHRQLPYGVPGAYRLLANLLALNAK